MLRTALRPRWLALLALVLVAATGMSLLGQWQLDRAREDDDPGTAAAPRAVGEVIAPRQSFPGEAEGDAVVVDGAWDPARQLLVAGRELDGRDGFWVLTPVRLRDGSGVPVVRGWVPSAAAADRVDGDVELTGRLEPAEPSVQRAPGEESPLPEGQVERIASPDLAERWPYPLITGYVVSETPDLAARAGPALVPAPPPETGLHWQNLSYAIQWWAFAAFGLFFWWRLVRDDHLGHVRPGSVTTTVKEKV